MMDFHRTVPFLRWAGSKRKLIPKLLEYWGSGFRRYVEPFMGSAALFYAVGPNRAILSDINSELVDAVRTVCEHPRAVFNRLKKISRTQSSYYRLRSIDPIILDPLDRAARFIFLNRFCFNGIYRTNDRGEFNVPFSPTKTGGLPSFGQFFTCSKLLRRARICCGDFEEILRANVRARDFVYLDPPYAVGNRRVFRQYGPDTFGIHDIDRLSKTLFELDRRGASFVLSYAFCREAVAAFGTWTIRRILIQRNVSGFAKHRRRAVEMLVTNIPSAI